MVPASSSPHIVPVPFSVAAAVDPEEAFVASLASCYLLWFLSICAKRGFCVNGYTDSATGEMSVNERGKLVISVVRLHPCVDWVGEIPDDSIVVDLHRQAHEECFIANSVRKTVLIEPLLRMDRKVQ